MDPFAEILAVDSKRAYRFFTEKITEVVVDTLRVTVTEYELMHVARFMAHFASTSAVSTESLVGTSTGLDDIFDLFVMDRSQHQDAEIMEHAGAQSLFLAGFFGDQLRGRHRCEWYLSLSGDFYNSALLQTSRSDRLKRTVRDRMSKSAPKWGRILLELNRSFREDQYDPRLIRIN